MPDTAKYDWKTIALTVWSLFLLSSGALVGTYVEGGRLGAHADLPAHREASVILQTITASQERQAVSIDRLRSDVTELRDQVRDLAARIP